jgi:hypothetical protein
MTHASEISLAADLLRLEREMQDTRAEMATLRQQLAEMRQTNALLQAEVARRERAFVEIRDDPTRAAVVADAVLGAAIVPAP